MADDPKQPNLVEATALKKLERCREQKAYWEQDFKEGYFFAAPQRMRTINSLSPPALVRTIDASELNTDEAFLLCADFGTEVQNAYMPQDKAWCEAGEGMDLPDGVWNQVKDIAKKNDAKIFSAMRASNLYPEVTKAFNPDLALGTVGMWIDRKHPATPIEVLAIPLRELETNLGPNGEPDDRFAVRYTRNEYVQSIVGEAIWEKVPAELKELIKNKPMERTRVTFGFWRDWERPEECWQHVVLIDKTMVHEAKLVGEGCCPLLVMRFNPSADWVWGLGPLLQGMPSLRQIDEMEMALQEHFDLSLRPPITFPNDSFTNVEQGLESGFAYPIQPGHEGAVKKIYDVPPAQDGVYTYEAKLKKLRKLFYVDLPEQSGDTPPTLGQWLDEMARAQRRLGTPGLPFWREGPAKIYLRFKYLLEKSGAIEPLTIDGRTVAILPRNPAQAAAEQQEVGMALKAIGAVAPAFPEEFKMNVDGRETMDNIFEKMRVTDLIVMRDKAKVAQAVDQMAKLAAGRHAPEGSEATPGPAA
jgi:hypothetical protein